MSPGPLKDILQLSVQERVQLAEDIWDSIAAHPETLPLTEPQKQELDRRLDAHAKDAGAGRSWEDIRAKLGRKG